MFSLKKEFETYFILRILRYCLIFTSIVIVYQIVFIQWLFITSVLSHLCKFSN